MAAPKRKLRADSKIDVGRALTLRLRNNLSYAAIGEQMGVSAQAVHAALQRFSALLDDPDAVRAYRDCKGDLLEAAELQLCADIIDPKRRSKATLNNTAYALRQISDMLRLERGQSTANISYADHTQSLQALRAEAAALREELGITADEDAVDDESDAGG